MIKYFSARKSFKILSTYYLNTLVCESDSFSFFMIPSVNIVAFWRVYIQNYRVRIK